MLQTLKIAESIGAIYHVRRPIVLAPENNQVKWYFVVDFESTCDNKPNSGIKAEIIEFPVVVVEANTGCIVDEFHRYVKPTENPVLSTFCKQLTGISQQTVNIAQELKEVLKELDSWLKLKKKMLNCTFKLDSPRAAVFATWTDWDIRTCLWNECQRKQLPLPIDFLNRIDLKAVFKQWLVNTSNITQTEWQGRLVDAIKVAGLTFRGRPHSGIDDARNTAALLSRMLENEHTNTQL